MRRGSRNARSRAFAATVFAMALLLGAQGGAAFGEDGCGPAWSWWTRPIAEVVDGQLIAGGVDELGDVSVSGVVVDALEGDDHDAPAVVARTGRPTLVFYTGHDLDEHLYYRIGLEGQRQVLTLPGLVTYAQGLTYQERLVVLTRVGGCRWYALVSPDWGQSFGAPVLVLDGCIDGEKVYMTTKPHESDSRLVRVAISGHPIMSTWRQVDYGLLNLATGRIWSPGHQQVANLYSGAGLPLVRGSLDVAVPPNDGSRLLDVDATNGGDPLVVYASWSATTAARYKTARYDRAKGTWIQSSTLPNAGNPFWTKSLYYGGAVVSQDGTLVLSREASGTWYLERYGLIVGKGWVRLARLARDTLPIVRPYPVDGTANQILAQRLLRYDSNSEFCVEPFLAR